MSTTATRSHWSLVTWASIFHHLVHFTHFWAREFYTLLFLSVGTRLVSVSQTRTWRHRGGRESMPTSLQGFSVSTLLTFGMEISLPQGCGRLFRVLGVFGSSPDLYPLDARSIPPAAGTLVCTPCWVSPGIGCPSEKCRLSFSYEAQSSGVKRGVTWFVCRGCT